MLALARWGYWDFSATPTTPLPGTVLLWTAPPTHAAVVTAPGVISGYNQRCVFPAIANYILTTGTIPLLGHNSRRCYTIAEATIVDAAGNLGL